MTTSNPSSVSRGPATAIDIRQATKEYRSVAGPFRALDQVTLSIAEAELLAVTGRSGSGKSTLLNLLSGVDTPTSGEVWIHGKAIHEMDEGARAAWRCLQVGIVFQAYHLLPTLTAAENVMLPMDLLKSAGRLPSAKRRDRALELLSRMEISDQADKFPATLSGGQQQRVAIARALANDPPIVLADEPTGNLDSTTAAQVLDLFQQMAEEGRTIVVVSHEPEIARWAGRTVLLSDGRYRETPPGGAA